MHLLLRFAPEQIPYQRDRYCNFRRLLPLPPWRIAADMQADSLEHQRTLRSMAIALERICSTNIDMRSSSPTVFDAVAVPAMSIHCYLVRMRRYTKFDFSCFLVALTYIDRLCHQGPSFCPTMHNIHRLLVASLLVASKATDDVFHANLFMAQCGGIHVHELNKLELELCRRLSWALMPSAAHLHRLRKALEDESSSYWDSWTNVPKQASTCDDIIQPCKEDDGHESTQQKRMPHAKSFQDHLGRMLFGAGSTCESSTAESAVQQKHAALDRKIAPPSPGSPRSVFRRIFSEQVFNFGAS
ncbi:hypothetical protein AB1Y20_010614 [Prymnesium parvum]|uniref:Cyclin n=1 Tax=Prymnesium parvum TaxID=97485 RepID=A0AB34ITB2_PRYPA